MATGREKASKISTVFVGIGTLEKRNCIQDLVGQAVLLRPFVILRVKRRTFAFAVGVNGNKPSMRERTVTCQREGYEQQSCRRVDMIVNLRVARNPRADSTRHVEGPVRRFGQLDTLLYEARIW